MPRTKSLSHYPERYLEIVRECGVGGKTVTVQLESIPKGLSLRGHWYAFVGSLKAEAKRIQREAVAIPSTGQQDILELAAQVNSVMVQINGPLAGGGCEIVWQNREHSWQARALRGATVTAATTAPVSTQLDSIASRLMQVQQEKDNDKNS